ncbi:hypothetical protein HELRODRAFT_190193 [Helobdella robusta]|uniref:RRM domain-containing protein n=1 Tax=Helobdella robusta TaxID=6412 RepID=T1FRR9_HELRO|nr:hypothetical protein HELRODRAFT_190193 [Helobdella robusta]ESO10824.1 hypothetical protein HELRODRAFT_190193 [Helobdella robusta]
MSPTGQQVSSNRSKDRAIRIRNLPHDVHVEDIKHMVRHIGAVEKCEFISDGSALVVFETPDHAKQAFTRLNSYVYHDQKLRVDILPSQSKMDPSSSSSSHYRNGTVNHSYSGGSNIVGGRKPSCPLRILVAGDLVGAIIGKKGSTVKSITTQHKARVDVHGKENTGLAEKVISIYGQPDNCSNALRGMLKILEEESHNVNRGSFVLKMLAEDRYCGRIIGKEGKFIKKVKEDTDTKITLSNMQDLMSIYPDRIITIKGDIDGMVKAQSAISAKLNECLEKDMVNNNNMLIPSNGMHDSRRINGHSGPASHPSGHPISSHHPSNMTASTVGTSEMCQISVPNSMVGSIIGAGGSIIKQIMLDSNAHVVVEPKHDTEHKDAERVVTIRGSADACWKASYFIFEKVKGESMSGGDDRLKTGIKVPKSMVGRIVGKNGRSIREIQRLTGANIKLPDRQDEDEVLIEVFGNFMATQGAHNRIRALISQPDGTFSRPIRI